MKFVLISRHTNGAEIPEAEQEKNLRDMNEWVGLLKPQFVIPIRGGKSLTVSTTHDYAGDIGGILVYEADSLEHALELARKSPGLKYGFTHEVFPEIALNEAARSHVNRQTA